MLDFSGFFRVLDASRLTKKTKCLTLTLFGYETFDL